MVTQNEPWKHYGWTEQQWRTLEEAVRDINTAMGGYVMDAVRLAEVLQSPKPQHTILQVITDDHPPFYFKLLDQPNTSK